MKMNIWPLGILTFFVAIVCVNGTVLTLAATGYGGLLDRHPYAKGLEYDTRRGQLEAFKRSGWQVALRTSPVSLGVSDRKGIPIDDADVTLRAIRPNAATEDRLLKLERRGPGSYGASQELSPGRWLIDATIEQHGSVYRLEATIFANPSTENRLR